MTTGSDPRPITIVISGPGGVGKSTIADHLARRDARLWLSRSWTTRAQREGEADSAYEFVTPEQFRGRIAAGGFLEWTEFLGHLYGTPQPEPAEGTDVVVLEIEVDGARQVKAQHPEAIVVFVLPPTRAEQERRLRERGDVEAKVVERLRKAESEEPVGLKLADHVLVNDDLDETVGDLLRIIDRARRR